jgi:hypothetical protein
MSGTPLFSIEYITTSSDINTVQELDLCILSIGDAKKLIARSLLQTPILTIGFGSQILLKAFDQQDISGEIIPVPTPHTHTPSCAAPDLACDYYYSRQAPVFLFPFFLKTSFLDNKNYSYTMKLVCKIFF